MLAAFLKSVDSTIHFTKLEIISSLALIQLELLFAFIILGSLNRWGSRLALIFFGLGFLFNLSQILMGKTNCGCFGALQTSPWLTASLDLCLFALFWVFGFNKDAEFTSQVKKPVFRQASICFVLVSCIFSFSFFLKRSHELNQVYDIRKRVNENANFDLAGLSSLRGELERGTWVVILYRNGCPHCKHIPEDAENLANQNRVKSIDEGVAILEVPKWTETKVEPPLHTSGLVHWGMLSNEIRWLVKTPLVIEVEDGIVKQVSNRFSKNERVSENEI